MQCLGSFTFLRCEKILTFLTKLARVGSKAFTEESVAEGLTHSTILTWVHLTRGSTIPVVAKTLSKIYPEHAYS